MSQTTAKKTFRTKLFIVLLLTTLLPVILFTALLFIINKEIGYNILLIASIMGVTLIFVSFSISNSFSKPITQLKQDLDQVSKVHFNKTIDRHTDDEFDGIVKSINNMLHMLQEREGDFKIVTTQRDQEKERITNERNMLSVILSGISDCVIAIDANKKILLFNKAVEELTGLSLPTAAGKNVDDILRLYDNKDLITASLYLGQSDKIAQRFKEKGLQINSYQDKKLIVSLISSPITLVDQSTGWVITFHDITQELESDELKIDFVSMAAHELRTPLTSVRGYASLLKMDHENELNDKGKEMLERLSISSDILGNLVENLLNVTRIEQNRFTISAKPIDLTKTIIDAVDNLMEQAKIKNQKLDLQVKGTLPIVNADAFRITQVVTNLVANAIHYTHEGGAISVVAEEKNNFLQFAITDTGEGIPEDALPKLFTKFFRVSSNVSEGAKGTGLGLFISKSIVELHKGKIWVTSESGKGSTFTFILPKTDST
jgi:two-component system phosphate regulon sensor histidine kinase PhoR